MGYKGYAAIALSLFFLSGLADAQCNFTAQLADNNIVLSNNLNASTAVTISYAPALLSGPTSVTLGPLQTQVLPLSVASRDFFGSVNVIITLNGPGCSQTLQKTVTATGGIFIELDEDEIEVSEGDRACANFTLRNTANTATIAHIDVSGPKKADRADKELQVNANTRKTSSFCTSIPSDAAGTQNYVITVSTDNLGTATATQKFNVISGDFTVDDWTDCESQRISVNQIKSFGITLRNRGDSGDYTAELEDLNGLGARLTTTDLSGFHLGDIKTLGMTVQPKFVAAGDYPLALHVKKDNRTLFTKNLCVRVEVGFESRSSLSPRIIAIQPAGQTAAYLTISNVGYTDNDYEIQAMSPAGLSVSLVPDRFYLLAGDVRPVAVYVTASNATRPGTYQISIDIRAYLSTDIYHRYAKSEQTALDVVVTAPGAQPNATATPAPAQSVAQQGCDLTGGCPPFNAVVAANYSVLRENGMARIIIINTNVTNNEAVAANVTAFLWQLPEGWSYTVSPATLSLAAGKSGVQRVEITLTTYDEKMHDVNMELRADTERGRRSIFKLISITPLAAQPLTGLAFALTTLNAALISIALALIAFGVYVYARTKRWERGSEPLTPEEAGELLKERE